MAKSCFQITETSEKFHRWIFWIHDVGALPSEIWLCEVPRNDKSGLLGCFPGCWQAQESLSDHAKAPAWGKKRQTHLDRRFSDFGLFFLESNGKQGCHNAAGSSESSCPDLPECMSLLLKRDKIAKSCFQIAETSENFHRWIFWIHDVGAF